MSDTVMGFDYGTKRIGVAIGNFLLKKGSPLRIIPSVPKERRWEEIEKLVEEWQPVEFVVGRPVYPDGTPHEMTRLAEKFSRQLAARFRRHTHMTDERYTSALLEDVDGPVDDMSAAIILEQWFSEEEKRRAEDQAAKEEEL